MFGHSWCSVIGQVTVVRYIIGFAVDLKKELVSPFRAVKNKSFFDF
jgi:hypothetical protein